MAVELAGASAGAPTSSARAVGWVFRSRERLCCARTSADPRREAADRLLRGPRAGHGPQVAPRDRAAVGIGDTEPRDPPARAPILNDHGLMSAAEDPLVGPL